MQTENKIEEILKKHPNATRDTLVPILQEVQKEYGCLSRDAVIRIGAYLKLPASSIYGVDILQDNVIACRERMFGIWDKEYTAVCKRDCNDDTRGAVKFILSRNIVCGNALTLMRVDENGKDTKEPIVFSEWAFITGSQMQRCDYTFAELLAKEDEKQKVKQQSVFDDMPSEEGKFLKRYISHYRRVQENG